MAQRFLGFALLALAVAVVALIASITPSFQECKASPPTEKSQSAKTQTFHIAESIVGQGTAVNIECVVVSLDENNGLITALATAFLAYITYRLVVGGEKTTRKVNRAYVACGGDFHNRTTRIFDLDVRNDGQTPAFMTAYDDQIASLGQVTLDKVRAVNRDHAHWEDTIPPRGGKTIKTSVMVPHNAAFVFGCVWYRDVWGEAHCSRFILNVRYDPDTAVERTFPDVAGVHRDYDKRT
jgi:hypothetical protein